MNKQFRGINLDVPSGITFDEIDSGNSIKLTINKPGINMQEDAAAFEGWALLMKCRHYYRKVVISFEPLEWDGSFENLTTELTHYMRFLFRLWRFNEIMEWVETDDSVKGIVSGFADKLNSITTKANYPEQESSVSEHKSKLENQTEKLMLENIGYMNQCLSESVCGFKIIKPHDQLPNGLFADTISKKTAVFPTGYLDLWAVDKDNKKLCIFELKVAGNEKVGIISELFFYAEYMKFVYLNENRTSGGSKRYYTLEEAGVDFRGYGDLQAALGSNGINGIKAVFLVEKLHSRLAENIDIILNELNKSEQIEYSVVYYDRTKIPQFHFPQK